MGGQVGRRAIRRLSQRDDGQTTIRNTTVCQQLGRRGEVLTRLVVVSDNSYNPRTGDIERRRPFSMAAWQHGSIPAVSKSGVPQPKAQTRCQCERPRQFGNRGSPWMVDSHGLPWANSNLSQVVLAHVHPITLVHPADGPRTTGDWRVDSLLTAGWTAE